MQSKKQEKKDQQTEKDKNSTVAQVSMNVEFDFNKIFSDLENIFKGNPNCTQESFTSGVVSHFVAQNLNVFICHPIHKCDNYDAKHHYEFKTSIISSKGYDIYLAHRGKPMVATNFGDTAPSQWAYGGSFVKDNHTIKFN